MGSKDREPPGSERGFTLVELMIAMLILAIVLAALAPAFYSALRATALSDEHSAANGMAVAAVEQMRAFPYQEIGFTPADYNSGGVAYPCIAASSSTPVQVTTSAIDNLATTETLNNVTYTIQRCVYWASSTISGQSDAYKQSVVTVTWKLGQVTSHITQTSAVYPGGLTSSSSTTSSTVDSPPSSPNWVEYQKDPVNPTSQIDLVWSEPSSTPTPASSYEVDYTTAANYTGTAYLNLAPGTYTSASFNTPGTTTNPNIINVSPSTTYYIEVFAVAADGTKSTYPSSVVSVTTSASSQPCTISNLTVNPTTAELNKFDTFRTLKSFSLSVNATNGCGTVTVAYAPTGGKPTQATMSGSGTLTGTAGTCQTVWNAGNQTFTVYMNGTPYSPTVQVQVNLTQGSAAENSC